MEQMTEVILNNGMKVHLMEIHTAPIISHWVWYRVGSRYENQGKTGISHWVEHMQFRHPPFPAGVLDRQSHATAASGMPLPTWIGPLSLKPCRQPRLILR